MNCSVNEKEKQLVFFVLIFKKNFIVSHGHERKEKNCLNCGTTVYGRYCHVCGQENIVPKETFWGMVIHFFYDITHFDSKFFDTVKDLIFRPGFLSKEYISGRRASYLHPVRMYVFTSAIFFLIFFSFFNPTKTIQANINDPIKRDQRNDYIRYLKQELKKDTGNVQLKLRLHCAEDTNCVVTVKDVLEGEAGGVKIRFGEREYKDVEAYDSIQKSLPSSKKDGWLKRRLTKRMIELNKRLQQNPEESNKEIGEIVLHRLPYLLFISLPLFALILKLVYIRRKQFYYMDHGIFTIHLYVFTFILLLVEFALDKLSDLTGWGFIGFIMGLLVLAMFFYLYKAMRNFYGQRRFKTFAKFLIVVFSSFIMMTILFSIYFVFSVFTL